MHMQTWISMYKHLLYYTVHSYRKPSKNNCEHKIIAKWDQIVDIELTTIAL